MSYSILIKPEAERDLQNAYLFYEEQRIGLGLEFLFASEVEINRIQRNPLHFQKKHREIRRAFTARFPFGVFFFIDNSVIVILGVIHAKMDESTWQSRQAI